MKSLVRTAALASCLAAAALAAACKREPAAPPEPAVPAVTADAPGCDVARAYVANRLARFADKAMVVTDAAAPNAAFLATRDNTDLSLRYNIGQEIPRGWPKDPPSATLAGDWSKSAQASPFAACIDFAKVVEAAGVQMGKIATTEKADKNGLFRTQINFAMPVISADGAEALVLEEGHSGPSVIDVAVHLRKDKTGAWKEADALSVLANLGS